ncbi:MAG TPA: VOC family protein [Bacteroidales bacterium]|nr:VOC family protein [Bacteroidales bacterium]
MIIDHICYAVKDTSEALAYWQNIFGYSQMTETIINKRQKVKVTFLSKEKSVIVKIIEPLEDNPALKKQVGSEGTFHHICFRCDDISGKITELKEKGLRLLTPPQPGEAFNNNYIAFMLGKYGMNFELIETDEKAGIIQEDN